MPNSGDHEQGSLCDVGLQILGICKIHLKFYQMMPRDLALKQLIISWFSGGKKKFRIWVARTRERDGVVGYSTTTYIRSSVYFLYF